MKVEFEYTESNRYRAEVEVDEDDFAAWLEDNPGCTDTATNLADYIREQDVLGEVAVEIDGGIADDDLMVVRIEGTWV